MASKSRRGADSWVVVEPHDEPIHDSWRHCPSCGKVIDATLYEHDLHVCPFCGHHGRLSCDERIALLADRDSFQEFDVDLAGDDPLLFPGYPEKVAQARERTGLTDAVKTGRCSIGSRPAIIAAMDSRFMMASMGGAVGEKLTRAVERATQEGLPVIICCCSGGARMQEGLISLMQMAKVSAALERHHEAGLFYLSIITDPTTGGVTASFAMLGDVIVSEPRALLGFAGRRVIESTIKKSLPADFQTAEFALEHGLIDCVVDRTRLRRTVERLVEFHSDDPDEGEQGEGGADEVATVMKNSQIRRAEREAARAAARSAKAQERERALAAAAEGGKDEDTGEELVYTAWNHVKLARDTRRPTAISYIDRVFDGFLELHGDRSFSDDPAILAGLAYLDGRAVTVIAQEKGRTTAERIKRNFGCANPEGYRKALRLAHEAETFGRPIVTIVDTQGAYCGIGAEERGQGGAIAENLMELSGCKVPIVTVLIGEGGSGGALALAVSDRVAMLENAVYSVLSPEGFASILWKDASRVKQAAQLMRMTADDALALKVIDEVVPEPVGGAQTDPDIAAIYVHDYLVRALDEVCGLSSDDLLQKRYERYRRY